MGPRGGPLPFPVKILSRRLGIHYVAEKQESSLLGERQNGNKHGDVSKKNKLALCPCPCLCPCPKVHDSSMIDRTQRAIARCILSTDYVEMTCFSSPHRKYQRQARVSLCSSAVAIDTHNGVTRPRTHLNSTYHYCPALNMKVTQTRMQLKRRRLQYLSNVSPPLISSACYVPRYIQKDLPRVACPLPVCTLHSTPSAVPHLGNMSSSADAPYISTPP